MTTIKLNAASVMEGIEAGGTANGRPVAFSRSAWEWHYTDTPADQAVEFVRGQIRFTLAN